MKPKKDDVKLTKLYDYVDKENDNDGLIYVSEYSLEGKGLKSDELDINKYVITISPDTFIYHTIIKQGHSLKNIIRFVHEHDDAFEET